MISITRDTKTPKVQFCAQRAGWTPTSQDCGFPFRSASEAIKPVLTASTALLFWLRVSLKTPIWTFDPQPSTLNHFHA